MRTFWIADPMPPTQARSPLAWGSSEWAADSCLAEWSEFEREWVGEPAPQRPRRVVTNPARASAPERAGARTTARITAPRPEFAPPPLPPFLVACFVLFTIGLVALAWSMFLALSV